MNYAGSSLINRRKKEKIIGRG